MSITTADYQGYHIEITGDRLKTVVISIKGRDVRRQTDVDLSEERLLTAARNFIRSSLTMKRRKWLAGSGGHHDDGITRHNGSLL